MLLRPGQTDGRRKVNRIRKYVRSLVSVIIIIMIKKT